jgi:hypothetical protein
MYCLKVDEIATVAKDVENEGINFSHLSTDLIDHICCEIESYMNKGISFTEAYSQVKLKFGIKGLRHIQQDTLMLIDKNYRIMKNSMKTIGVIALALMAFAALFKIMHWPFSGPMLVLSFFIISFVFFPALLYVMFRDVNQKQQAIIYIVAFISGLIFMSGVLFKIMHWPFAQLLFFPGLALITYLLIPLIIVMKLKKLQVNKSVFLTGMISLMIVLTGLIFKINHWGGAGVMLVAGAVFMIVVFLPMYYYLEVRKSENLRIDFLFGIVAITYFIVFTSLQSLPKDKDMMIDFNFQSKSYDLNSSILNDANKGILNQKKPDKAIQLANQADIIDSELEDIKLQVIQRQFNINRKEAIALSKKNIYIDDNENDVAFLLPKYNPNSPLPKLKNDFEDFNKIYILVVSDSLNNNVVVNQIFNTDKKFITNLNRMADWEEYCLMDFPPAVALNAISFWQYNISLAENKALSMLVNNSKIN